MMYRESGVEIDRTTAGLLMSAIISDTLLFRSPTCTPKDEKTARELAEIVGVDIEKYAFDMFSAGSNLKGKTIKEIFYQDFKHFKAGKVDFRMDKTGNCCVIAGKLSFDADKLLANVNAVVEAVQAARPAAVKGVFIKTLTLSSTMGIGVPCTLAAAE